MGLFDRFRGARRAPGSATPPGPATPPPKLSPTASLMLDKDWEALAAMGEEGRDALFAALGRIADLRPDQRAYASTVPDPHATFPLVVTLVDLHDPEVPALFAELLEGCTDLFDPLAGCLMEGLARTGTPFGAEILTSRAFDDAAQRLDRNRAAWVLAHCPNEHTAPAVMAHLDDETPARRVLAAQVLGEVRDARAVEPLVAALADPEMQVRDAAAVALGSIGDARARLPLLVAEERDRRTRRRGHPGWAFDARVGSHLLALDTVVSGTDHSGWVEPEDACALEQEALERIRPVREELAAEVEEALAGVGVATPGPLSVAQLVTVLEETGATLHAEDHLTYDDGAKLELDLTRCTALGCPVSGPESSATVPDPQGGEMWDETWTARCTDGDVRLTVTRRYAPMF